MKHSAAVPAKAGTHIPHRSCLRQVDPGFRRGSAARWSAGANRLVSC